MGLNRFVPLSVMVFVLLLSSSFTSLMTVSPVAGASTSTEGPLSYEDIMTGNYLSINRMQQDIMFFTQNATPRVTGYSGCYIAQQYIYQKFIEYNLTDVQYQWYNITIPMDLGGTLNVYAPDGTLLKTYTVSHLWPNSVQVSSTPPGGINAKLFYAEKGDYADYNSHMINESIVMLDFNTDYNWLKAMGLGAKAIIFIEPDTTSNLQSLTKYLYSTPICAPRVYLRRDDASNLLGLLNQYGGTLNVKLESRMEWQVKRVANVVGFSPGTTLKDQWIILFAHYDAWSVVPNQTEGATDACGIAALLETVRFYAKVPHARSIMFVALSGYGEGLGGARYFADSLLVGDSFPQVLPPNGTVGQGIFFFMGMDLSPETDTVGPVPTDYFYYPGLVGSYNDYTERFTRPAFYQAGGLIDKINNAWTNVYGRKWTTPPFTILSATPLCSPTMYVVDAAPFNLLGHTGSAAGDFTYLTIYAYFDRRYTPVDTFSRLESLSNLKPQMEFILCTSYDLAYTTKIKPDQDVMGYNKIHWQGWSVPNFFRVTSQVVTYNESTANYESLPNSIVQVIYLPDERVFGCRATWFETADDEGYFTSYAIAVGRTGLVGFGFYPYSINETSSRIVYAPDDGRYGGGRLPHELSFVSSVANPFYGSKTSPLTLIAFRCGTIQIFDTDVSEGPATIILSQGWVTTYDTVTVRPYIKTSYVANDPASHSSLIFFGYRQEWIGPYETQPPLPITVFVRGDTPVEIIIYYTGELAPLALLHNSTLQNAQDGYGYSVQEGETLSIINTPLVAAKELNYLDQMRIRSMVSRNIFTTGISYVGEASNKISLAEDALNNLNYSDYYDHIVSAVSVERQAYGLIRSDLSSVLSSTLTLFITILMFAYLAERLFFSSIQLKRRAIGIAFFTILGLIPLIILHPGFTIANNVYVAMYGIVVLVFIGMVWALLFGYSLGSFRRLREKIVGKHFMEVSRVTSLMTGMGLGLQYMKKRRLRASLTLVTLVIVSASIVMFTSVTNISFVKSSTEIRQVTYTGVYAREFMWNPLNPKFIDYLTAKLGEDNVLPAAWLYARMPYTQQGLLVTGPNGTQTVNGVYGLTPQEGAHMGWTNYLKSGLWFQKGDYDWIILSEALAQRIGANVGDAITLTGAKLRVRGIIYDQAVNVRKLDGDQASLKDLSGKPEEHRFLAPQDIVYVPYHWAMDHGGKLHEIDIVTRNADTLSLELAKEINLDFYAANKTGSVPVEFYSRRTGLVVSGYEFVTLPLILAALTVLNLMLGAVYERIKEIAIFSTVGMSPSDVGMMFLSESISYGVIGVIIGYIAGIIGLSLLLSYHALPLGIYPNYSSGFVVQIIGIIILITVLSSLFPFLKSGKMVTPSLERKWKVTTKPLGDQWNIPTPFFFSSEQEAGGFIEYMNEYFGAYTMESPGFPFAAHGLSLKSGEIDGIPYKSVVVELHLAPFPANVNQTLELMVRNISRERWTAEIIARRRSGDMRSWMSSNQKFLDSVRKQFINWRLLTPTEKEKYYRKGANSR